MLGKAHHYDSYLAKLSHLKVRSTHLKNQSMLKNLSGLGSHLLNEIQNNQEKALLHSLLSHK